MAKAYKLLELIDYFIFLADLAPVDFFLYLY